RVTDRPGICARLLFGPYSFAEQAERIGVTSESAHVWSHRAFAGPHLPGWAVPGECVLLVGHHRRIAHAGEEVVRLVVFADVIQAKTPVFLFAASTLRGTVRRFFLATMPLAAWAARSRTAVLLRLYTDTVKKG